MTDGAVTETPEGAVQPIVAEGRNCWRVERAERASVVVDAADYYHLIHEAMDKARQRILILGWDFDTRICLEQKDGKRSETLGHFFLRLAKSNPAREIDILKWNFGALKQFLHPRAVWFLLRWSRTRAIDFRLDSAHPPGCSHHQKIVVIDEQFAVCGGIDISTGRWDTPQHRDNEPGRRLPSGKPYMPWHDATMLLTGDVAGALADLGRDRWHVATNGQLPPLPQASERLWPDDLPAQFENVQVAIARTRAPYRDVEEVREIEALYLDMIAAARRFIYFENQYFTSAKVAAAIANRMEEADPPEIVMVMPRQADGWLEQMAMDAARVQLARAIAKVDRLNRFRIYVPVTDGGTDIYVHAKVSIVDDRLLRVGSSNLNNRSLGLDSECDVVIDAGLAGNRDTPQEIARIRNRLLAEHLGVEEEAFAAAFAERGSLVATIEALRSGGKTLDLLDLVKPGPFDAFIAENELLDPEHAEGFLDPLAARGLRKQWERIRSWRGRARGKGRRRQPVG